MKHIDHVLLDPYTNYQKALIYNLTKHVIHKKQTKFHANY